MSGKHALQTRKLDKDSDILINLNLSAQDDPCTKAYKGDPRLLFALRWIMRRLGQ
jgi:hypothetical protein